MADITKCVNEDCKMKEYCYRYTRTSKTNWQSYSDFVPMTDNYCQHFWDNGRKNDKN